ncbi:MAG: hypothetical protein ACP5S8_08355 [Hydrogenobaculum sp.]
MRVDVEKGVVYDGGVMTTLEEFAHELLLSEMEELTPNVSEEDQILEDILKEIGLYKPDMF